MEIKTTKIDYSPRSQYIKNTGSGSVTSSSTSSNNNEVLEYVNKMFTLDVENQAIKANYNFFGVGEISAYGLGSTGGTGGGISYDRLDLWNNYDSSKSGYVLSAGLGNDLNSRLIAVEVNGSTSISTSGTGNAITDVVKSGSTLVFNKGLTFADATHVHTFASLTSKPTTLSGYGITDALGINSNAASATKLANIRTIWGQNFDGGANVTGNLTGNYFAINDVASNPYLKLLENSNVWYLQGYQNKLYLGSSTVNSLVIDGFGKTGIGTTNPRSQLSFGQSAFGKKFALYEGEGDGSYFYGIGTHLNGSGVAGLGLWGGTESNLPTITPNIFIKRNSEGGFVGIGTDNPLYNLDVNGNAHFSSGSKFRNVCIEVDSVGNTTGRDSEINCYNSSLAIQYNTPNNLHLCQGGGNVAVGGTVSTGDRFTVYGTTRMTGSLYMFNESWLNLYNPANTSRISLSHNSSLSKLDIYNRTTSSYADVECGKITGTTFNFTSATGGTLQAGGVNILRVSGTKDVVLSTPIAAKIYFRPGGDISTTGQMILDASGNLVATGEITAYSASDMRLKTDIQPIRSCLDIINKLNPVSYKWNDVAKSLNPLKNDCEDYGLIAQELEKVLPNLVHSVYDKYKSVDYVKLVPFLVAAIKEQSLKIERLEKQISR